MSYNGYQDIEKRKKYMREYIRESRRKLRIVKKLFPFIYQMEK